MKNTPHIKEQNRRHASEARVSRGLRGFPPTQHDYQTSQLAGSCGTPAKFDRPAFFEISKDYFAEEAAHTFVIDAGVFAALMATVLLPIANSLQAIATLIQTVGVF